MHIHDVMDAYFDWLIDKVCNNKLKNNRYLYSKLLRFLLTREFFWSNPMDSNRARDGEELRNEFLYECPEYLDDAIIFETMGPSTVLEMMVALAIRMERDIMSNNDYGDRTERWFWDMIISLNLDELTDEIFDREYVKAVLYRCLNRSYDFDGNGGFFTIPNCQCDMRDVEIWYQMLWYLDNILDNEEE